MSTKKVTNEATKEAISSSQDQNLNPSPLKGKESQQSSSSKVPYTPLVRLDRLRQQNNLKCTVLAKCGYFNKAGLASYPIASKVLDTISDSVTMVVADTNTMSLGYVWAAASKGLEPPVYLKALPFEEEQNVKDEDSFNRIKTDSINDINILHSLGTRFVKSPISYENSTHAVMMNYGKDFADRLDLIPGLQPKLPPDSEEISELVEGSFSPITELKKQTDYDMLVCSETIGNIIEKSKEFQNLQEAITLVCINDQPYPKDFVCEQRSQNIAKESNGQSSSGNIIVEKADQKENEITENAEQNVNQMDNGATDERAKNHMKNNGVETCRRLDYEITNVEALQQAFSLLRYEGIICSEHDGRIVEGALKAIKELNYDADEGRTVIIFMEKSQLHTELSHLKSTYMVEHGLASDAFMEQHFWWWDVPLLSIGIKKFQILPFTTHISKAIKQMRYHGVDRAGVYDKKGSRRIDVHGVVILSTLEYLLKKRLARPSDYVSKAMSHCLAYEDKWIQLKEAAEIFTSYDFLLITAPCYKDPYISYLPGMNYDEDEVLAIITPEDVIHFKKTQKLAHLEKNVILNG